MPSAQCNNGTMRVLPGDSQSSYLMDKLLGIDLCAGTQMPKMGGISQGAIENVANWICGGALNN